MIHLLSLVNAVALIIAAFVHIYWGLGGQLGLDHTIPVDQQGKKVFEFSRIASLAIAGGLIAISVLFLVKIGFISLGLPSWLVFYSLLAFSGIFIMRALGDFKYIGFTKKIKDTQYGHLDTKIYSPIFLIIGILSLIIVLF